MSKVINVPQGCYAEISSTTPDNILGLSTFGIYTCCVVVVINTNSGYVVLCHADDSTLLEDPTYGMPSWIRRACPEEDYHHLRIYVGDQQGDYYFEQVQRSIEVAITNIVSRPVVEYTDARSIFIDRDGNISGSEGTMINDLEEIIVRCYGDDIYIDQISIPSFEGDERAIGGSITNARDRAIKKYDEKDKPPICIFRNGDFLSLNEMQAENPSIKFGRVIKEKGIDTESDHSDERSSYSEAILKSLLKPQGLYAVETEHDGNCFFHAIARQFEISEETFTHEQLRQIAVHYMTENPTQFEGFTEETLDEYIAEISRNGEWADNPIMQALVDAFNINIDIYRIDGTVTHIYPTNLNHNEIFSLRIAYTGNHYLSVEALQHESNEETDSNSDSYTNLNATVYQVEQEFSFNPLAGLSLDALSNNTSVYQVEQEFSFNPLAGLSLDALANNTTVYQDEQEFSPDSLIGLSLDTLANNDY